MNDLRPQLAPGWSPVNIGLMILLFIVFKPLGFLMLAYILVGGRLGLDLGRPDTFSAFWQRLAGAWQAGGNPRADVSRTADESIGGGTPAPVIDRARELDVRERELAAERDALARERDAFEREKREQA